MIKDERIISVQNEIQARGFQICVVVLMAGLYYRQFYLRQHPREYWDVALALFGALAYVGFTAWGRGATRAQGERGASLPWPWWRFGLIVLVVCATNSWYGGVPLDSAGEAAIVIAATIAGALAGVLPVVLLFRYLGRRWNRRSGGEG
jgi:hypothetical protein